MSMPPPADPMPGAPATDQSDQEQAISAMTDFFLSNGVPAVQARQAATVLVTKAAGDMAEGPGDDVPEPG